MYVCIVWFKKLTVQWKSQGFLKDETHNGWAILFWSKKIYTTSEVHEHNFWTSMNVCERSCEPSWTLMWTYLNFNVNIHERSWTLLWTLKRCERSEIMLVNFRSSIRKQNELYIQRLYFVTCIFILKTNKVSCFVWKKCFVILKMKKII